MNDKIGAISSRVNVPPKIIVKNPIYHQSFIENIIFGKILKKFGLYQLGTYYRTMRRNFKSILPYMPDTIPNDAFLYDFHSHTKYSDGKGNFKQILLDVGKKKHLNGLAFTDHPWHLDTDNNRILDLKVIQRSFKAQEIATQLKKQGKLHKEFVTFPGSCEFFMKLDENNPATEIELIALGVPEDFLKKNDSLKKITNMLALEFIEKIHDENGLVIIPHPFYYTRANEILKFKKLNRNSTPDAFEGLNYTTGFLFNEAFHPIYRKLKLLHQEFISLSKLFGYFGWISSIVGQKNTYGKHFDYPLARKIASVGSSDAHFLSMVGAGSTMTKDSIHSIEDLREILKNKRGLPMLNPKWNFSTKKEEIFQEVLKDYLPKINELIRKARNGRINQLILLKIVVKFFSRIFYLNRIKSI